MKAFNIIAISLSGAVIITMTLCVIAEYFLGPNGGLVVIPLSFLFGFNSRRVVEKMLGYTLYEAMQDGKDESNGK